MIFFSIYCEQLLYHFVLGADDTTTKSHTSTTKGTFRHCNCVLDRNGVKEGERLREMNTKTDRKVATLSSNFIQSLPNSLLTPSQEEIQYYLSQLCVPEGRDSKEIKYLFSSVHKDMKNRFVNYSAL